MAEDDDDESFGDFTFASASYPSSFQFHQPKPSSQINGPKSTIGTGVTETGKQEENDDDDDDEWGDFVETALGSAVSSGSLSKPIDPFNFFASNPSSQSQSQLESGSTTRAESGLSGSEPGKKTTHWVKITGAIPLSIFGDAEEEEKPVEEERPSVNDSQDNDGKSLGSNVSSRNYNVNNGSEDNTHLDVGMSYGVIANLYNANPQINLDNRLVSNENVLKLNTNGIDSSKKGSSLVPSGVSLDLGSAAQESNSDTLVGLSNQNQKVNIQDGARLNGTANLNLDVLNMDFNGWNIGSNSKYLDMIGSESNQIELNNAKSGSSQSNFIGLELDLTQNRSSNFDGWNFDFGGFKPDANVLNQDFQVSRSNADGDPGDDNDDGDWEFKDGFSESKVSPGNEKAESEEQKVLEANMNLKEFVNDSNRSMDLFSMSSGSFDFFSMSNGISGSSYNVAVGLDSKSSTAAQNTSGMDTYSKKEQTECNGRLDSLVGKAESEGDFGEFAALSEETGPGKEAEPKLHDSAGMNSSSELANFLNGSTDFFEGSAGSIDLFAPVNGNSNDLNKIDVKVGSGPSVAPNVEAAHNDYSLEMSSRSEKNNDQSVLDSHLVVGGALFDDDFGEFTIASAESAGKPEKAQTTATASADATLATIIEEIQEAYNESSPKAISKELEDCTGKESDLSGLLKILQEPGFGILESEYSLQTELNLVKKDSRATIQVMKHAKTMLKLLSLGSAEEQLTYVSIWSKMISACAEELRYGAQIWRQSFDKNLQSQILTDRQGKRFLLSLGEVYRVAIILEASIRLYKPWTLLSSSESSSMRHFLDECHALWQSSGLAQAVLSISVSSSVDGDNSAALLVDSIKYTLDLDGHTLEKHVFTHQQPLCQLSLLTSSVVPGMAFVEWGGLQCFAKLANLWANLISNDIPKLPFLVVNC